MKKTSFLQLQFLTITTFFLAIFSCSSLAYAQDLPSNAEYETNGANYFDPSANNIVYNFNQFADSSVWNNIQYPYATFYSYNNYLIVSSQASEYATYPKFIGSYFPRWLNGVGVYFTEPVHNLSFSVVGGDGGTFKVNIFKNRVFSQTLTFPASCGNFVACFVDLRSHTNVTGIDIHSIDDAAGLGFDDFSFTLGAAPPDTQSPIGYLDGVTSEGFAHGWSLDLDAQTQPNTVLFYIDGALIGSMVANQPSPDIGYPGSHRYNFAIPNQFRDGTQHTISAYGLDVVGDNPRTLLTSPRNFTLNPLVSSVVFDPVTNQVINGQLTNSEIDRPTSGYASQRIFPDKKVPDDTINHKTLRVKAVVGKPNVMVYFKNFDVDDPSDDENLDDPTSDGTLTNDSDAGNDNRDGRVIGQPYPATAAGILSATSALSDASGEAVVYFTVTKQPGDNFVVAASTDETYLNGTKINGTGLKDSTNNSLPTMKAKRTELLTVWRKFYIEMDSMGEVAKNFETGYYAGKGTYIGSEPKWIEIYASTIFEKNAYKDTLADNGTYSYGGRMDIAGVHSLQVLDSEIFGTEINGNASRQKLLVKSINGNIYLRPNHSFKLYDDDDFDSLDGSQKDGDNGENVDPLSDTLSHMQDSDNKDENAFAEAYIKPEYQWAQPMNNSNVDFVLYSPCTYPHCAEQRSSINANRGSQTMERDDFWVGYLLVSYQGDNFADVDPTGFLGGIAPYKSNDTRENEDVYNLNAGIPPGGIGSVIFIEGTRDYGLKPAPSISVEILLPRTRIAPHEVGHQFGIAHNGHSHNGGVMSYQGDNLYFSANHINMMRWRIKSPGEGE